MPTVVLEAGSAAGASVREWGHVRLFSAWSELVDPAAEKLLAPTGWSHPDASAYPTGADWAESYLTPLADALDVTDEVQVRFDTRVVGVAKHGRDRLVDHGREEATFTVHVQTPAGLERLTASAVIDASGTWTGPNPLGADGLPAIGEAEHRARITYGIPDFTTPTYDTASPASTSPWPAPAPRPRTCSSGSTGCSPRLRDPHLLAGPPASGRRRVRWRRQRPARGPRRSRQASPGGGRVFGVTIITSFRVGRGRHRRRPGALTSFDGRRVERGGRDRRGDRLPARPELAVGGAPGSRPGPVRSHPAGAAHRPERPLLRHGLSPWCGRARATRAGLLPRRDEVLRPRAVVPRPHRVRADPQHHRSDRRRPRGGRSGRARAPRVGSLRRLRTVRRDARGGGGGCCAPVSQDLITIGRRA